MKIVTTACACAALTSMACASNAASMPSQLYNKTISVSFSLSSDGVDEHGGAVRGRDVHQTIYISTQGRIFFRADNRAGSRLAQTNDYAPEATSGEFHFDGNRLVRTSRATLASGALNETISFDAGFENCTANIQLGHESGKVYKWRSLDGRNITATSLTASTPTCSIREGNAFAQ